MRKMVVTSGGETRAPSFKTPAALPVRQHIGLPSSIGRKPAGLTSSSAPHKTDLQHFNLKHGFVPSFGDTGEV